ncbi:hypothetical protein GEOBC_00640 [Geobacteraceae bacterium]|nr:hypothetical protein GEOBC_00640 [Geobacteraceae bacterium]
MVTILLIADQDRLEKLFDFVRDYPQIRFRVSRSLRQGSQDIAEDPPDMLFVQNHLSGLSGEIIARHLIGQVEGMRPRVVLFGEAGKQVAGQDPLDVCLDITRTDEELTAAIIGIISDTPSPPAVDKGPPLVQTEEQGGFPTAGEQPNSPVPPAGVLPPIAEQPMPASVSSGPDDGAHGPSSVPPLPETPFDQKLKAVIEQSAEPVPLAELEDTVSFTSATSAERPRARERRQVGRREAKPRSPLIWIGIATAAVVAVGAAVLLLSPTAPSPQKPMKPVAPVVAQSPEKSAAPSAAVATTKQPLPAAAPAATPPALPATPPTAQQPIPAADPPQTPAGAGGGLAQLPPFIPREGHDRDYGKSHPGWERYRGARTEFKVYRDGAGIRAVQAIDRSGVGIPETFFRGALSQMAKTREFTLEAKETQGKFRVEKGKVNGGVRLVIYRTVPNGAIRAFVVHFN